MQQMIVRHFEPAAYRRYENAGALAARFIGEQAGEDTFKQAIRRFKVGNLYVGSVTMITAVRMVMTTSEILNEWSYTTPMKHRL